MNKGLFYVSALMSGAFFGAGLALSGMISPDKVIAFLNVAAIPSGEWDPSLAFVMGGALTVFIPCYFFLIKPRAQTLTKTEFCVPQSKTIDAPLLMGAALFGIGWGLVGLCPGPALASLGLGDMSIWIFFVAMLAGSFLANALINRKTSTATNLAS
ncbi:YeeE/YedE family protein [Vibrio sp. SM6]|uniref:YeeE/YedE family protein n=1 Tax=Vibrio agarilyticus TaxID=2726741 RepID=A0A7X8YHA7_9VIBR|nr:YeeE/YedE family protein [Vibrio agarilyticus]NLS13390.1 YeeE/YedE family protein [Vibrio agarilyticus]